MSEFPEVVILKSYLKKYEISIQKNDESKLNEQFWVHLSINKNTWKVYIDDEYNDFNSDKKLVGFYLVLIALDDYHKSTDILNWAKELQVDASNPEWLKYYKTLDKTYNEILIILGEINPQISYFDYSMKTELGLALLNG